MKKVLLILILALPVAWWFRDPDDAKAKLADGLKWAQEKVSGLVSQLESNSGGGDSAITSSERRVAEDLVNTLPQDVYLLRENLVARFLPVPGTIYKGTKVKIIGSAEGKLLITDGSKQALAEQSMLTRDAKEAPGLLRAAQDARAAAKAKRMAELQANLQQIDNKIGSVNRELSMVRQRDAIARDEGKKHAQYGTQESFLLVEIKRQEDFKEAVMKEIESLNSK